MATGSGTRRNGVGFLSRGRLISGLRSGIAGKTAGGGVCASAVSVGLLSAGDVGGSAACSMGAGVAVGCVATGTGRCATLIEKGARQSPRQQKQNDIDRPHPLISFYFQRTPGGEIPLPGPKPVRIKITQPRMQQFPTSFAIGPVRIAPATVLAPMAGVTDTVFRRFIRNLGGCGLIMTEFTSSHGVSASLGARKPTKTLLKYLAFEPEEHPISAQLFGADPQVMADAARVCQDLGFDILDINFGCPVNKVVKCNGGSGLLRDLPLVERILRDVREAISIPFTMKFRAGWSDRGTGRRADGAAGRRLRLAGGGAASAHARAGL